MQEQIDRGNVLNARLLQERKGLELRLVCLRGCYVPQSLSSLSLSLSVGLSLSLALSLGLSLSLSLSLGLSRSLARARARSLFPKTVNQTVNRNPEQEKYEAADGGSAPKNWLSETAVGSQVHTCTSNWVFDAQPRATHAQGAGSPLRGTPNALNLIHVVRKLLINPDHTNPMAAEQATLRAGRGARTAGSSRDDVSRDYQWCCLLCYTTEWPKQRFEPLEGVREILAAREKEVKRHFNVSMDGDATRKEARR